MRINSHALASQLQSDQHSPRMAGQSPVSNRSPIDLIKSGLLSTLKSVYLLPHVGIRVRSFVEKRLGSRDYQNPDFWNKSLAGWASGYLGGTLSIDMRNSLTMLLARRHCPGARSILDLGCAGATLAKCLDRGFTDYCGVDISEVAISKAGEDLKSAEIPNLVHELVVSTVESYQPSREFDVIVFNEVMYYMDLDQISASLRRYAKFLTTDGVILISLKDHEQCRCVQAVIGKELDSLHGILFQEQICRPGWRIVRNRENPAFLIQAFKPKDRPRV